MTPESSSRRSRRTIGAAWLLLCAACTPDGRVAPEGGAVAAVELSKSTLALPVGGTAALEVVVRDADGQPLPTGDVYWSTSNANVAKVTTSGVVTALALGSATIAATVQGRSATAVLTVAPRPVSSVRITPSALTLDVGKSATLAATALDATGTPLGSVTVGWRSNNSTIATVDASGRVTAVGGGATTISASVGDVSALAAVAVSVPVPSTPPPTPTPTIGRVVVTPSLAAVKWSGPSKRTVQLEATAYSSAVGGSVVSGVSFTWTSSDTSVAKVSASGLVTAIGDGVATITARSGGASGLALITSSKK